MSTKHRRKQRKSTTLRRELEYLLNRYSREQASNTPDFILARYLMTCLAAYEGAVNARDEFFSSRPYTPSDLRAVQGARPVEMQGATAAFGILDEIQGFPPGVPGYAVGIGDRREVE